ncbi:MAG: acyl-CoA thioesterase [Bdellovibrionales bacterium]
MPLASEDLFQSISFKGGTKKYFVADIGRPRFNEIDHYGVVWNGHFITYFETARHQLCRFCDFDMQRLSDAGVYLPVSNIEIKIKKPILPRDEIKVAVRASLIEENRFEFFHLLLVNNEVRASGSVQHIPMDKSTGTVAYQLPENVVKIMKPLSELFAND